MAGPRHLGYWWHVESQGPDGYDGLRDIIGSYYFIESDTPVPKLEDKHQFGQHDKVLLPWKSDHAPFADYIMNVYRGVGCLNVNLFSKDFISGKSPGKNSADVSGNDLKDGEMYSWSVTPAWHMEHSQCFQGKLESACVSFQAPAPICGNGVKEEGEQCDDGNLQEGDGCSSQCKEVLACGQQQGAAGGINQTYEDQPLDLGGNKGRIRITAQTYTIPDRLVFRHDNEIIYEIDCYGTEGEEVISRYISGGSSNLYITVEPGCDDDVPSTGTKWAYTVSCVDDTSPLPDHSPE